MYPLQLLLLAASASAHFTLNFPASRGDNDDSQDAGPCGGLDTPSTTRTPWPLMGGQLSFEAGHDAANTAVYLALGNAPVADDFTVILADKFLQVGIGEFCWNELGVPADAPKIEDGMNATIQVVQQGHSGGGLYNCADITFKKDAAAPEKCSNGTNVKAEPAEDHGSGDGDAHAETSSTPAGSTPTAGGVANSSTAPPAPSQSPSGAEAVRVAGGVVIAAVVGAAAWVL